MSKGIIHRIKPAKLDGLHAILTVAVFILLYINISSRMVVESINESEDNVVTTSQSEQAEAEVVHSERGDKTVLTVKSGDTLCKMLSSAGLSSQDSAYIGSLISKYHPASQLSLGQKVLITYKPDKITDDNITYYSVANSVSLISDQVKIDVTYDDEKKDYTVEKIVLPVVKTKGFYKGQISESLYGDAIKAGVSPGMILEFIQRYSYIVDFQRDIQSGDEFELFYEYTSNESGKKLSDGPLLYGNLISGGKSRKLYRHTLSTGNVEYFNESGVTTRTTLLLTPINGAKISSKFGMRKHPILGYTKKHEGLDYAAPKGTPILSSGDGIIEEVKYASNGYGKYIKIRHTSKYQTLYAHMDRFAKTSKKGARVSQGDVIGFVGTTGNSTGPHLHYEVIELGKKINPSKVSFPKIPPLGGKELQRFKEQVAKLHEEIKLAQKS